MTQYKVTKDEYKELVNRYWGGEITLQQLDQYEIILPIQPTHEKEFINNIIRNYCDDARKEENRVLFMGMFRGSYHMSMLENGFKYMPKWSNGYRDVFVSEKDKCIITYCEGDLSVSISNTEKDYQNEIKSCEKFYDEY